MADSNTMKNLQNVVKEVEAMEFEGNCQAYVRQHLLEVLYRANELLECLLVDAADAKLKPRKKKGSE